jgi:autotransporter adhesin
VALGYGSYADRPNTVSVGSPARTHDGQWPEEIPAIDRQITHVAAGTEDTDAVNVAQLRETGLVDGDGHTVAAVTYDNGGDKGRVTLGGNAGTVVANVAAGTRNGEAINVEQFRSLAASIGGGISMGPGGLVGAPSFAIQGSSYFNVGDALGALDGALSGALDSIGALDDRVGALEQGGDHGNGGSGHGHGNAASGTGKGLAIGDGSHAEDGRDTAIGSGVRIAADGSTAVGANAQVTSALATNSVAIGADSTVSQASGTAVGQARTVDAASGTAIGNGASVQAGADNAVALGAGSVATEANTVSVGSAGNERRVSNVAAGTAATDAANVSQVDQALETAKGYADAGDTSTLQKANAYTDQKFGSIVSSTDFDAFRSQVNDQFHTVNRRMDRVGALGTAMAQKTAKTTGLAGTNPLGVGVGSYGGESALSVGYQRAFSDNRASLSIGGAVSGDESSVGVGAGFSW